MNPSLLSSYMTSISHSWNEISVITVGINVFLLIIYLAYKSFTSYQNGLIITSFKNIPIKIVSNSSSLKLAINELLLYNPLYLGIDCEWRPNTKGQKQNKISLIQIAHKNLIILIRLNKIKNIHNAFITSGLLSLFSNPNIIKCGVGVYYDKKKLFKDYHINILGCVELNDLYYKYHQNHSTMSLKKLCKLVCDISMTYKLENKSITLSDWATDNNLTNQQIHYAAEDAMVGYYICNALIKQNITSKTVINSDIIHDNICCGIIDRNKWKPSVMKTQNTKQKHYNKNKDKNPKNSYLKHDEKETCFYDNCKILKPNGDFLSWCRRKTLNRYVNKGYAWRIDDTSIKLKFEPENFNRKPLTEVVLGFKKNECSVCGANKKLMRYFVVPLLYRKYLPDVVNEETWRRHDMLPLCQGCHDQSQIFNERFKELLCNKYGVQHYRLLDRKLVEYAKVMKAIKPLMSDVCKVIPKEKKIKLLGNVARHFDVKYEIVEEVKEGGFDLLFGDLIRIDEGDGGNKVFVDRMRRCYDDYIGNKINIGKSASEKHSKDMIKVFEDDVVGFIKLWRQQFVDNMKPKYLPGYWSVDATFFDIENKSS